MTEDSDSISRLSSFRLLFSLGRKFTCAGTSRYRDRYAGVSGPEKSTLLWSNADSTVDARQWNHGMAGGIHTTQIEANSFIHFPYCALWLAQAVTVTCIYRLQVWVEAESTFLFSPNTMVCSGRVIDSLSLWPKQLQVSCHFRGCQASCPFIRNLSCHKDVCFFVWFFRLVTDRCSPSCKDIQLPGSTAVSLYCSNPSGWCWKQLLAMYRKWSNCQLPCPHSKSSDFSGSWQRLLNPVAEVIAQKAPAESVKSIQVKIFEANLLKRWCLFGGHKE